MKTRVRVKLVAECEVEIETEHAVDESPTDLSRQERRNAETLAARTTPEWIVERVEVIS